MFRAGSDRGEGGGLVKMAIVQNGLFFFLFSCVVACEMFLTKVGGLCKKQIGSVARPVFWDYDL
jgi:hypothetical protein